jgi:hypothetical protein
MSALADDELFEHLAVEFGEHGRRAVEFLRSAQALLDTSVEARPSQSGACVAYCLREAMTAISASQPDIRPGEWKTLSRQVVEAKQRFVAAQGLPGEDVPGALKELLHQIDNMANFHEQTGIHQQGLITAMIRRTGSQPMPRAVQEYQELRKRLNGAVHRTARVLDGPVTIGDAHQLLEHALRLLRRLLSPPDARNSKLAALAALPDPSAVDCETLMDKMAGPQHFRYFLSKIEGPSWLRLIEGTELLKPPNDLSEWSISSVVDAFRDHCPDQLSACLQQIFDRWGTREDVANHLAWSLTNAGPLGHPVMLRTLRKHPTSRAILQWSVTAAARAEPSTDFVHEIFDIVLSAPARESAHLDPSLCKSMTDGLVNENYHHRIRLICYKINSVTENKSIDYCLPLSQRGSISDLSEEDHGLLPALLCTLVRSLRRATEMATTADLLGAVEQLKPEARGQVRSWILGNAEPVDPSLLVHEIRDAISSRSPNGDDALLVDLVVLRCESVAYVTRWAQALGPPPSVSEIGVTLAANEVPAKANLAFEWSPLLPSEVLVEWRPVIDIMVGSYGEPIRVASERIERPVGWIGRSPISGEEMQAMGPEEAARRVAAWQPDPTKWGVTSWELARTLQDVVAAEPIVWGVAPLRIAGVLRHPAYISHYLNGLTQASSFKGLPISKLIDLGLLIQTRPWLASALDDDMAEGDRAWREANLAVVDLIEALAKATGFAGREDDVWSFLRAQAKAHTGPSSSGADPLTAALNRPCTRALKAVVAFVGHEYRTMERVRPEVLDLFTDVLTLAGEDGAEHRAILAPRIAFLRHVAPDWVSEHRSELFGETAPDGLGQTAVDLALTWAQPNSWLLESFPEQVRHAVSNSVERALEVYLVGMLWSLPEYTIKQVIGFLRVPTTDVEDRSLNRLSLAGETLGRLLNTEDAAEEHLAVADRFWEEAIAQGSGQDLRGFGWFAEIAGFDDVRWATLTRSTLEVTGGSFDWAARVARRASGMTPSPVTLGLLNLLVRGDNSPGQRHLAADHASLGLHSSTHLSNTQEYQRLRTALIERGVAVPPETDEVSDGQLEN